MTDFTTLLESEDVQAWAQVILSLVTIAATVVLGIVTINLTRETKLLAERSSQPFVVCALESSKADSTMLDQVIHNSGNGTAFDIEVRFSPELPKRDYAPNDGPVRKVSLLPSGRSLPVRGVVGPEVHQNLYTVEVSWSDAPGSFRRHQLRYNLSAEDGFRAGWTVHGLHQIAGSLKKIEEDFRNMRDINGRLRVTAYDREDRRLEAAQWEQQLEKSRATQQQEDEPTT